MCVGALGIGYMDEHSRWGNGMCAGLEQGSPACLGT